MLEREFTRDGGQKLAKVVSDLNCPHVYSDQSLDAALERMGVNQLDVLPVVNRPDVHQLEGVVTLRSVLGAYGVDRDTSGASSWLQSGRLKDPGRGSD
jgi:CBS domain-containing protein